MGLYDVPLSMSLWEEDYVSQLPSVWYCVALKSSFQYTREVCKSMRAYVF